MKNRVLIIKFMLWEGPGLFRDVLQKHGITADVIEIDRGEIVPSVASYDAVLMMGGTASANDTTPAMRMAGIAAREAIEHDTAFLGVCLGHQVLAKTVGAQVRACAKPEVGFLDEHGDPFRVTKTNAGQVDPIFAGLTNTIDVFQLHGEEVVPSADVTMLATSNGTDAQAIRVANRAYGFQYHMEVMPEMLAVWSTQLAMLRDVPITALQAQFAERADEYVANGRRVFTNFLSIAGLIDTVDIANGVDVREAESDIPG